MRRWGLGLIALVALTACGTVARQGHDVDAASSSGVVPPTRSLAEAGWSVLEQDECDEARTLSQLTLVSEGSRADCAALITARSFAVGDLGTLYVRHAVLASSVVNSAAESAGSSPMVYGDMAGGEVTLSIIRTDEPRFAPMRGPIPPSDTSPVAVSDALVHIWRVDESGAPASNSASAITASDSALYRALEALLPEPLDE